jgi:hypothetical protein
MQEDEHQGLLAPESEVEPSSGNAKAERRGKGIWYSEELDRDIWGG